MASQKAKYDFFRHLNDLDDESTASEDDAVTEIRPSKIRKIVPAQAAVVSTIDLTHASRSSRRESARNIEVAKLKKGFTDIGVPSTDIIVERTSTLLRRTNSEPDRVSHKTSKPSPSTKIFDGLEFFCLPNNDVAKLRRLRMQSAILQGAKWSHQLTPKTTHVIVDSDLKADAVTKVLTGKIDSSNTAVVNDKWLIESLTHKIRKDTKSDRFQFKGLPSPFYITGLEKVATKDGSGSIKVRQDLQPDITPIKAQLVRSVNGPTDDLLEIVQELKGAIDLPFDAEVDLEKLVSYSSGDDEEDPQDTRGSAVQSAPGEDRGFVCMEPNTGKSDHNNPNNRTIEILQQMATYYDRTGDNWRTLAYRKAISALRNQTELISTRDQARTITLIGGRLADKIEEIVTTDRLRKLDSVLTDPDDQVLQLFMGVYGAGLKQAKLWIDQGYRTLDDLAAHAKLTANQQIGVEHYHDFQQRISRSEVAQHGEIVQAALQRTDKRLQSIIGGSFRRGMPDSGDIDIMITHPNAELPELRKWVFETSVPYLVNTGFLKHVFATSRSRTKRQPESPERSRKTQAASGARPSEPDVDSTASAFADSRSTGTKFHGASALPASPTWRRIDLLLVPASVLGASLLYFTGNDIFNRSMRLLASRKGIRLNQYGLYRNVLRGKGRIKEAEGELLEGRDERKIFEILGVPWREPEERRC